jgi:predicted TIM-barrel fold metal-dependent hydrolase
MKTIDFEAHFYTQEYVKTLYMNKGYPRYVNDQKTKSRRMFYAEGAGETHGDTLFNKLLDLGKERLKEMDNSGIDVQVLSLSAPGIEQLDAITGTALARNTNNELSEAIQRHSGRFIGYAALAPKNPEAAAAELERTVKELGFKGWKTHSNFGDSYLDEKRYWPILKKAEELGVPIYLHPTVPAIPQLTSYDYVLAGAAFGFGFEAAMCLMRMILSGVFDQFPRLNIILGHLGEALPFQMKRIDWPFVRPYEPKPKIARKPSEYIESNVFVTTSGYCYQPAFMCTLQAMGSGRILLGTDYPYESMDECIQFMEGLPIAREDKDRVYYHNASRLGIIV